MELTPWGANSSPRSASVLSSGFVRMVARVVLSVRCSVNDASWFAKVVVERSALVCVSLHVLIRMCLFWKVTRRDVDLVMYWSVRSTLNADSLAMSRRGSVYWPTT